MSHTRLRPLVFGPVFLEKLWGGDRLATFFPHAGVPTRCGEAWLLSDMAPHPTFQTTAPCTESLLNNETTLGDLIARYGGRLLGQQVLARQSDASFPLLIKWIDAQEDLSIQVHPDDALAQKQHGCRGKSEMWYVLEAQPQAQLVNGFTHTLTPAAYQAHLRAQTLHAQLHHCLVHTDDAFFIPSGRIHSIGKGIVFAEIQQSSDITYRIDDFGRLHHGKPRQLHTEEALSALSFEASNDHKIDYAHTMNQAIRLVRCPYFCVQRILCKGRVVRELIDEDSFVIYMCLRGALVWEGAHGSLPMQAGRCVLVPAESAQGALVGDGLVLECWVPKQS